jgi:hypothetical protein
MKKFECTSCTHRKCTCELEDTLCSPPQNCINKYVSFIPNWHEVKEETTTKSSQLPDWCKVGEWVYNVEKKQYQTISLINGTVTCKNIDSEGCTQYGYGAFMGDCVEARKRPFNAEEMQGLVGKVIETKNQIAIVIGYIKNSNRILLGNDNFLSAEQLINLEATSNCKPCYVLEHKNEKGEWVE